MARHSGDRNADERDKRLMDQGYSAMTEGNYVRAKELFTEAADLGCMKALPMLARLHIKTAEIETARHYISILEDMASDGDIDAIASLAFSYEVGWPAGVIEDKDQKYRKFMELGSQMGDPFTETGLAIRRFYGLMSWTKDRNKYKRLIWSAIDKGYIPTMITHAKLVLKHNMKIEHRFIDLLQGASAKDPQIETLLDKLQRRKSKQAIPNAPR